MNRTINPVKTNVFDITQSCNKVTFFTNQTFDEDTEKQRLIVELIEDNLEDVSKPRTTVIKNAPLGFFKDSDHKYDQIYRVPGEKTNYLKKYLVDLGSFVPKKSHLRFTITNVPATKKENVNGVSTDVPNPIAIHPFVELDNCLSPFLNKEISYSYGLEHEVNEVVSLTEYRPFHVKTNLTLNVEGVTSTINSDYHNLLCEPKLTATKKCQHFKTLNGIPKGIKFKLDNLSNERSIDNCIVVSSIHFPNNRNEVSKDTLKKSFVESDDFLGKNRIQYLKMISANMAFHPIHYFDILKDKFE